MNTLDLEVFGEDERRIRKSNVRHIFTPHKPITDERFFRGRLEEMKQLLSTLNTPGEHALLYGDRGVGKSSLANIAAQNLVKLTEQKLIIKRCDSSDNFLSIIEPALIEAGCCPRTISITSQQNFNISIFKNNITSGNTVQKEGNVNQSLSPSWVAQKIKDLNVLLLIDEFDAIQGVEDKYKVAELIKQLSDSDSKLKILIVGIAESSSELTEGHPSVQRCLKEIKLSRMKLLVFTLMFGKEIDVSQYTFVSYKLVTFESILLFLKLLFVYSIRIVIAYFLLDFFILCIYAISSIFQYVSNEFIKERPNIKVNREESINDTMQEEYGNLPKYLKIIFIISFILAMLYVLF